MPKEFSRTLRLGEQIRRDLAEMLRRDVKDPRLSMVTINDVEVSGDLAVAKVFYTILGSSYSEDTDKALARSAGFLRNQLGKRISSRRTPELRFTYDETEEKGDRIEQLIYDAVKRDKEKSEDDSES